MLNDTRMVLPYINVLEGITDIKFYTNRNLSVCSVVLDLRNFASG